MYENQSLVEKKAPCNVECAVRWFPSLYLSRK
jgi:hypothetical protein